MRRIGALGLISTVGCLALVLPAAGQPVTSSNGCHVYEALATELEFQPFGHLGSMQLRRVGNGQLVNLVFDCLDFPPEPEAQPEGIQRSVSACNWRMLENGVKGTNRAQVRWFPNPVLPGRLTFTVNGEIVRGNRYPSGFVYGQGEVDQAAGTIALNRWTLVACRRLGADNDRPQGD